MPKVFTGTAQTSTKTIGWAYYGGNKWFIGADDGAFQGTWNETSASDSRIGVMEFTNAFETLRGKKIKQITLDITAAGAGSNGDGKVLTFCKQAINDFLVADINSLMSILSVKANYFLGDTLGTLTGKFFNNTTTHILNSTTNTALFNAMVKYFEGGAEHLMLYNGETKSGGYSSNYAKLTKVVMTVEYNDKGTVFYNNGGQIVECAVFYNNAGNIVQVKPYYCNGGTIVEV